MNFKYYHVIVGLIIIFPISFLFFNERESPIEIKQVIAAPLSTSIPLSTLIPIKTPQPIVEKIEIPVSTSKPVEEPKIIDQKVINSVHTKERKVALTFDDGPEKNYTLQILDILKKHNIKATFFVVGEQVSKYPEIVKRIVDEGHDIGNHSWNHPNLAKLSSKEIKEQIDKTDKEIMKITGNKPILFRAPYGSTSKLVLQVMHENNKELIGWSVDSLDWKGSSPSKIMDYLKTEIGPGGIVLQHSLGNSNIKNTVTALPLIIEYLQDNNYEMVTISELLKAN